MLALIKNLPRDSAFKLAVSDYDWPLEAHLVTGAWNEIKALRTDLSNGAVAFKPTLPPSAIREQEAKQAQVRAVHDDLIAQLRG